MKLRVVIGNLLRMCNDKAPTILTGFGIAGTFVTGGLAFRAGLRAHDILENHKKDMELVDPDDKNAKREVMGETVKDIIPVAAPPIIFGALTITCIFMSNKINAKRIAVLGTAYAMSEKKLKEYQDKVQEMLGEQKAQDIRESISKDHVEEQGHIDPNKVTYTGYGEFPTIDRFSKRVFGSTAAKVDRIISELSGRVMIDDWISLNEFYSDLGLEEIPYGDDFGWISADLMGNGRLPIYCTSHLNDDNVVVLNIEYDLHTRRDYDRNR